MSDFHKVCLTKAKDKTKRDFDGLLDSKIKGANQARIRVCYSMNFLTEFASTEAKQILFDFF